jgi:CheY-like chemotaxis protein
VLVVEDDESVRAVAIEFLERAGFRVLPAGNGDKALELYQRHASAIDLVLLDLAMPGLGGDVVFRRLREMNPHLAVILTSGYGEQEVLRRFQNEAPAGFLHKPYSGGELTSKVQEILAKVQRTPS